MLNQQKPEPRSKTVNGDILDVHSIFYTIQGEGPFTGHPAIFIRLAGCNLQCPHCDTEYTEGRESMTLTDIFEKCLEVCPKMNESVLIVITGGEPFRQKLGPLCHILWAYGNPIQIESNGVLKPDEQTCDMIRRKLITLVCSPKTSRIHEWCATFADCFKYVVNMAEADETDGLPTTALGHKARPRLFRQAIDSGKDIYISPADMKDAKTNVLNTELCVELAKDHGYILNIQMHKIIGVE